MVPTTNSRGAGAVPPVAQPGWEPGGSLAERTLFSRDGLLPQWLHPCAYGEQHSGLPAFGYPITVQQIQTIEGNGIGSVQWFGRDQLEDQKGSVFWPDAWAHATSN